MGVFVIVGVGGGLGVLCGDVGVSIEMVSGVSLGCTVVSIILSAAVLQTTMVASPQSWVSQLYSFCGGDFAQSATAGTTICGYSGIFALPPQW